MKQSVKKITLGTAALYCRLSRGDNINNESNSISNHDRKQITIFNDPQALRTTQSPQATQMGHRLCTKGPMP